LIDSRTLNNIFLEKLYPQSISLSGSTLQYDNNGNIINDNVSGSRNIYAVTNFSGTGFIIHSLDKKRWSYIGGNYNIETNTGLQNFYFNTILKDDEVMYVKCSARLENINSFDGNTATLTNFNSNTHAMFKVFINGAETSDYTLNENVITFNSKYNYFNNNITVVYYLKNQTFTGSATLLFYGVNKSIPSALDYMNGYSMSGSVTRDSTNTFRINGANTAGLSVGMYVKIKDKIYTVTSIINSVSFTINESLSTFASTTAYIMPALNLLSVDTDFSLIPNAKWFNSSIRGNKLGVRKLIGGLYTTSLTKWIDGDDSFYKTAYNYPIMSNSYKEYINYNDKFRIVCINSKTNEMTMAINARLSDKSSDNFNTDKRTETLNIEFESKVKIINFNAYGNGYYGESYYGGIKIIKD